MNIKYIGILLIAFALQACSSQVYNNSAYLDRNNIAGKKVAILPVHVEFTGRLPQGYTPEKKASVEESESTLIQNLVYGEYLYKSKNRRKQKPVELINPDLVNSRLKDHGISIRESWAMSPEALGKITGADLVLKVHVKKDRIMSETASFGIGVATSILGSILNGGANNTPVTTGGAGKTYTINFEATLADAASSTVISRFSDEENASWSNSPENVIKDSGKKIVRKGSIYTK
jgi:hypothetical protein